MSGVLYLVGTPIGNLGDLSERARETLSTVALVAAEDTRRSGRLLQGLDIRKPLVSMFEGNEEERAAELVERLEAGEDVAVVTDGGMPSISDPGYRVVRLAVERGIDVRVIPGPSAAIAALDAFDELGRALLLVALEHRHERRADAEAPQEAAGATRVFRGEDRDRRERLTSPVREIA